MNRLSSISEMRQVNGSGDAAQFSQAFTYDRWGNRQINAAGTTNTLNEKLFAIDAATNRMGVPSGQLGTMTYDTAGNLTGDTYTGTGTRTYDAENRMTSAVIGINSAAFYTYDADGRRVRRQTPNETVWQVYGMDEELLAEYAANAAPSTPQKEYSYRNGELLVTATAGGSVCKCLMRRRMRCSVAATCRLMRAGSMWSGGCAGTSNSKLFIQVRRVSTRP